MTGEQVGFLIVAIVVGFLLGQAVLIVVHRINIKREEKRREERLSKRSDQ